jgi:hypothetical protein
MRWRAAQRGSGWIQGRKMRRQRCRWNGMAQHSLRLKATAAAAEAHRAAAQLHRDVSERQQKRRCGKCTLTSSTVRRTAAATTSGISPSMLRHRCDLSAHGLIPSPLITSNLTFHPEPLTSQPRTLHLRTSHLTPLAPRTLAHPISSCLVLCLAPPCPQGAKGCSCTDGICEIFRYTQGESRLVRRPWVAAAQCE